MTTEHALPQAVSLATHEFRTPLTVVSGYLRMLLNGQGGPITDTQRKMLEEAAGSCARMSALADEMSEFAKLQDGRAALTRRPYDLAALVAELASGMQEGRDRGVRIEPRGCDHPVLVTGDRARMKQALGALMHAALREQGESIVIVAECTVDADAIVLTVCEPSLAPALRQGPQLTPPFADEWWGGTGFSRPLARWIIEAHGGALWSAGEKQLRSAICVRLPIGN
jgi:signal transduction histidine kinase